MYFLILYNKNIAKVSYKISKSSLENFQSLNIPCTSCIPSIWEIEQISGLSLVQAQKIREIMVSYPNISKEDFEKELINIKGIGKKKSKKIIKLFYY